MWTARFGLIWRKMETAAQDRAGWTGDESSQNWVLSFVCRSVYFATYAHCKTMYHDIIRPVTNTEQSVVHLCSAASAGKLIACCCRLESLGSFLVGWHSVVVLQRQTRLTSMLVGSHLRLVLWELIDFVVTTCTHAVLRASIVFGVVCVCLCTNLKSRCNLVGICPMMNTQWCGSGGTEAYLSGQLASFSALTLLVGSSACKNRPRNDL